jgi:FtsP/CotA-like multicopper oxidase with cupredoxin domain
MREKSPCLPLVSLVLLTSLTTAAVQAQPPDCGVPPTGQPWGCALKQNDPPSIFPNGSVLDTSLVMRERKLYVPVWTPSLCKGSFLVCTADSDCPGGAKDSCANARTCSNAPHLSCTGNEDCNTDAKCVSQRCSNFAALVCESDADCQVNECVQTWGWQIQNLRPYGSPKDPNKPINPSNPDDPNIRWGYPGPVLHARATTLQDPTQPPGPSNRVVTPGTRIKIKLYNYLPPQSYADSKTCNPATYKSCTGPLYCTNDGTKTCTKPSDCAPGGACLPKPCSQDSDCTAEGSTCVTRPVPQTDPNCFHGNSVTNLHLHGSHVSPQEHQDFVLLNLYPFGSTGVPTGNPEYAVASYQMDVNPLPWNQPPGTHWYHPHKHGSTSIQVQGGMAGGLIITGAFDDWLKKLYGDKLVDRVMAVQQIAGASNFFNRGVPNYPPQLLLNGYATPVIKMRPGEVQRFRFIGGSTQSAATLEIGFDPRFKEVRQIAQDGVQFAWQNYDRQPLRDSEGTYSNFKLGPGNRADFLVKAPDKPGIYTVNRRTSVPLVSASGRRLFNLNEPIAERVPPESVSADRPPVDQGGNPLLFTIEVSGSPNPMSLPVTQATDPACRTTPKPVRCWPDTPYYLRDLDGGGSPIKLAFSINGEPAFQPNSFWINNSQYDRDCAGVTTTLGTTRNWLVSNALGQNNVTRLAHPFHIHTNPFQVIRIADRTFAPPYIWWDSLALPVPGQSDRPAGPILSNADAKVTCPRACQADNATWNGQWKTTIWGVLSVCGCVIKSDDFAIRQRYDDYTGAYVLHCHFLGHEDRGMMWNVQTVCPPGNLLFGQPQANGGADNCRVTSKALDRCSTAAQ